MIQNGVVENRLSFKTKFYYGIASFGKSLVSSVFAALLPIFYQDYLGLSARWIGIASVIYAVWNAINDPLFGQIPTPSLGVESLICVSRHHFCV